ncbi:MAG: hypothetical protein WD426_19515 [Anditalea sp.]
MKKEDLDTIEITLEDIELIMGDRFSFFPEILDSCFCVNCESHQTSIINYKAYLNNLQDIILEGQCVKCGRPVGRYMETGENKESVETAKHIRNIKKSKFR